MKLKDWTMVRKCPSCIKGDRADDVLAVVDPHACDSDCPCRCHQLWAELRALNKPIGKPL